MRFWIRGVAIDWGDYYCLGALLYIAFEEWWVESW